jgi:membrane-bound serine protease (ClpP class)
VKHRVGLVILLAVLVLLVRTVSASAQDTAPEFVSSIVIDGTINPAVAEFVRESIHLSHRDGARALVMQLDTPGGLLSSTRAIVKDILSAPLPVIVYVAPSGASAGSAGVFITLAAHVAAMAPGTTIGAAHPAGAGGRGVTGTAAEKVENFVASYGETLARRRGRNVEWAVRAVRESVAVTEVEAVKLNVIDLVAQDLDDLLQHASGRTVEIRGEKTPLALAGLAVHPREMRLSLKVINLLADPNIAYLLLLAGILGVLLELAHPGVLFPGVTGAICLVLALMAFQVLPINSAGVALIVLAAALLIAEAVVPGFGLLGISGMVSLLLGSLILFDAAGEGLRVDRSIIVAAMAVIGSLLLVVGYLGLAAQRRRPVVGREGLVGEVGRVSARIAPVGKVQVHGELWTAESEEALEVGEVVQVSAVEDLHLQVRRAERPRR